MASTLAAECQVPAFLIGLIDEAQQSDWDVNGLWDFFKSITLLHPIKIVLFASYGSPGGGYAGFDGADCPLTPVVEFGRYQLITMKHDPDHDHLRLGGNTHIRRVGLLLDEGEAHDVVKRYVNYKGHPGLSSEVIHQIFEMSDGHFGAIFGLMEALWRSEVSLIFTHCTAGWLINFAGTLQSAFMVRVRTALGSGPDPSLERPQETV
jgi:hypothetical protein